MMAWCGWRVATTDSIKEQVEVDWIIVIPFVKRYRRKKSQKQSFKQLKGTINDENFSGIFPVTYLHERFGGIDNTSSNQSVKRTEMLHHVSSSNVSYKIFSILTWALILILWGFVTVCRL